MRHRLFIAVDLPAGVRQRLALLVADAPPGVRPVQPRQIHLTLHFLGDADDTALAGLAAALPLVSRPAFTMDLVGTGVFPPRGRPTVLWAGVGACESLRELHARVADILAGRGFASDPRPWIPHVTLARLSPRVSFEWTTDFLSRHRDLSERGIPVTAVCLYDSMRTSAGPVHLPAATLSLTRDDGPRPPHHEGR